MDMDNLTKAMYLKIIAYLTASILAIKQLFTVGKSIITTIEYLKSILEKLERTNQFLLENKREIKTLKTAIAKANSRLDDVEFYILKNQKRQKRRVKNGQHFKPIKTD